MKTNIALKLCFALILLLVGLSVFGCAEKSAPEGGSGVTLANGILFLCPSVKQAEGFGCAAPMLDGKLVAVNASDGNRLWEVTLKSSRLAGGYGCAPQAMPAAVYGNPAVDGDRVYIADYSGKVHLIYASTRSSIDAFLNETSRQPIVGGPVVAGDRVYLGSSDGRVYALDGASLVPVWDFLTGGKLWSTPAIDGDTLYIGSFDKKLYALNIGDGGKKWEFETEGAIISSPLVYNNTVYIGSFDRHLYAINVGGSLRWKFKADSWFWAKPVIFANTLYAPCLDGKVYILDAETGVEVAGATPLGSPISSSPVLLGSSVIIASEGGKVYALDVTSNQIRLLAELGEKISTPLSAAIEEDCPLCGVIYVYTQRQNLYALDLTSGARLWSQTIK